MARCGRRSIKYLFFGLNFIVSLGGGAILALGIIIYFGPQSWIPINELATLLNFNEQFMNYITYLLIGSGAIIFVVAFMGCCGALMESNSLLFTYFLVLLVILGGEISAVVLGSIYSVDLEDAIDKYMLDGFRMTYGEKSTYADELTKAWQLTEASLECCGYYNGIDYSKTDEEGNDYSLYRSANWYPEFPDFPESCCVGAFHPDYTADSPNACKESWKNVETLDFYTAAYHGEGCKAKVVNLIGEYINWIRAEAIGVVCIEIFCMVFAICLCRSEERG